MIPADLLQQFQAKDPELWEKLQDQLGKLQAYQEGQVYEVDVIATMECLPQISGWILQGLLQDAIRARGWWYQICYGPHVGPDDRHCEVFIWADLTKEYINIKGDTEAAALLRAYLAALGATE